MTAKAAASETLTAVVNGSVTPSVISFLSSGSGRVSTSISVSRKTNARMKAGTIARERDQDPRAQLPEMLDERRFLAVLQPPRQMLQGHVPLTLGDFALARLLRLRDRTLFGGLEAPARAGGARARRRPCPRPSP